MGEGARCFPLPFSRGIGYNRLNKEVRIVEVGRSINRVDAADKVTGRARYTDDFHEGPMLVAKILHSTIANGVVKSMDILSLIHI